MNTYIAYLRVSTTRQGTFGVSLSEQRLAISQYAASRKISIGQWFLETESAAKSGRPIFRQVVQKLHGGQAHGLIIHRIDRGARNLGDWALLGELIDSGIDVRFVHDELDLSSRGGRLAADIQAVVAADYIRNLRDETRKGIRGRFRQGLYPLPAPLGYLDQGGSRPKTLDPARASLVRSIFTLYASGNHTLRSVQAETYGQGLRNRRGRLVTISGLSRILHNPFYTGMLHLRRTDERFVGIHEPLVTPDCFSCVQQLLRARRGRTRRQRHVFLFRGLLVCDRCQRLYAGERQKGHVYYRCHSDQCRGSCVREETLVEAVRSSLGSSELLTGTINATRTDRWTIRGKELLISPAGSNPMKGVPTSDILSAYNTDI